MKGFILVFLIRSVLDVHAYAVLGESLPDASFHGRPVLGQVQQGVVDRGEEDVLFQYQRLARRVEDDLAFLPLERPGQAGIIRPLYGPL